MIKLKQGFNALILCVVVLFCSAAKANKSNIETSGDIGVVMLPALAWGLSQWQDDKEGQNEFYWSLASTLVATELLKYSIHEERPDSSGNDSFPSGHTSLSFQAATYVQQRYGWKIAIPFYTMATYVGWSRIHSDKHYTKDVLAGALIGIISAHYFTHPYKGVSILPYSENGEIGLNFRVDF